MIETIAALQRQQVSNGAWLPRLVNEARLRQLDCKLADKLSSLDVEVERAVLLNALDRSNEAQQAFISILSREPTNFSALNEFGTVLASSGFIAAACRLYSEAILHHPTNPMGHVNLANLLLRGEDLLGARHHYEIALRISPNLPQAHQGLGAVFAALGQQDRARIHFQNGFKNHFISSQPYRGTGTPVSVLLLVSSGGGNIPTATFLDDKTFQISIIVADFLDHSAPLPPHQVIFNSIGDVDLCGLALDAATNLQRRTSAPIINNPTAVGNTGRIANAQRLGALPGVVTPRTIAMPRTVLNGPDALSAISRQGFRFPLLLRSPGYHTGHNFVYLEAPSDLADAIASLPGDSLLLIEYLDARGADGNARKYRVMFIDGKIFPLHLAVSEQWKVHYFSSNMAETPSHRLEEAEFLRNMSSVLGPKAVTALALIRDELKLDYGGVDFGLSPDGDILLFEANATMVVFPPGPDERWSYRCPVVNRILSAARTMVINRALEHIASPNSLHSSLKGLPLSLAEVPAKAAAFR